MRIIHVQNFIIIGHVEIIQLKLHFILNLNNYIQVCVTGRIRHNISESF